MSVNITQFILYGCFLEEGEFANVSEEVQDDLNIDVVNKEDKQLSWLPDCYGGGKDILAKVIYQGPYDEQSGAEDGIIISISEKVKQETKRAIENLIGSNDERSYNEIFINYCT